MPFIISNTFIYKQVKQRPDFKSEASYNVTYISRIISSCTFL